ncbi:MAG: hypothetical protein ABJN35_03955 [Erythrobacter sp.]
MGDMIEVENVNLPGANSRVNRSKYSDMKSAFDRALPTAPPGMTQSDIFDAVKPLLNPDLFPGGKTSGWWAKTVQLDLEAKGLLVREHSKPLRWHWKQRL